MWTLPLTAWATVTDPVAAYLNPPFPVAAGFSVPTGWSSCGPTCLRGDAPREVEALAAGQVVEVGSTRVVLAHSVYVDDRLEAVRTTYDGVSASVEVGQVVAAGGILGTGSRVIWDVDGRDGVAFVAQHASLFDPTSEEVLIVISHDRLTLSVVTRGVEWARVPIALGQAEGDKARRGDNRTPKGMYFVVARSTGPFTGPTGPWFGGYWIKLNYPNAYDARRGEALGWIGKEQAATIAADWSRRQATDQGTALGSGIGLHGWIADWSDDGPRGLSWGCVVLHPGDAAAVYGSVGLGTMVVLM